MDENERQRARLEVVEALLAAVANAHEVVDLVSSATTRPDAAGRLRDRFGWSAAGADAVLGMQVMRLTAADREALVDEREAALRSLGGDT